MPENPRVRVIAAEFSSSELALRIREAILETTRPEGKTNQQLLDEMEIVEREDILRAARAAIDYITDCFNASAGKSFAHLEPAPMPTRTRH